tara:strand:+ start:797 stop:2473 length:1677 start_codon:yes stop_codon:yes gene_type:complete
MSPSNLPSKGNVFKFGLRVGAAVAGYYTGTGGWGRAFKWLGYSHIGIGAYDGWRMNNQLKEQSTASRQQGVELNSTASESALPILYGKNKVGLKIIDIRQKADGSDYDTLAVTGAICVASGGGNATAERGINAVEYVYFDEVLAIDGPTFPANDGSNNPNTTGMFNSQWWNASSSTWGTEFFLRYMMHNGSQTAVDYYLNNQFSNTSTAGGAWGTQTIGQGVAYCTFWMHYSTDAITGKPTSYPNALPNITMIADGNRVPNVTDLTSAQAYSINPAKCIYDFMTSKTYGMGIPGFDIDTASFETARSYCDESVTIVGASGTITTLGDRYTCNGILDSAESPLANLEKMLTSCNGRIVYENGKYSLKLRKVTSAETFELNEDNIVGDLNFRRAGIDETCNSITVEYVDHDQNFTPQTITWPYPDDTNPYLVEDGGMLNELSVELPFTNNEYMAVLLAAQILLETRTDITCTLTAQREALKLTVGSVVKVTHSTPGWTEKLMWVEAIAINGDGTVQIALKEYADATYTKPTFKTKVAKVANNLPGQYSSGSTQLPSEGPL